MPERSSPFPGSFIDLPLPNLSEIELVISSDCKIEVDFSLKVSIRLTSSHLNMQRLYIFVFASME